VESRISRWRRRRCEAVARVLTVIGERRLRKLETASFKCGNAYRRCSRASTPAGAINLDPSVGDLIGTSLRGCRGKCLAKIKLLRDLNQIAPFCVRTAESMEEAMCDYSLEAYRSRPALLGERYETHRFESYSIGFIAPGDPATAVCLACDTRLRLEGIPEKVQRAKCVSANEDATFTRLEKGRHHDGVRFTNGAEVTLQELGPGVKGYLYDNLVSLAWMPEIAEAI